MKVAAIIMQREQIVPLLNWAKEFAGSSEAVVHVFAAGRFAKDVAEVVQERCEVMSSGGVSFAPESIEGSPTDTQRIIESVQSQETELVLLCKLREPRLDDFERNLTHQLFNEMSSPVMILRPSDIETGGREGVDRKDLLVPVAGGPHSKFALQISATLCQQLGGRLTALRVISNLGEESCDVANLRLEEIVKSARIDEATTVERQIVVADEVADGISRALEGRGVDLIVIGASNTGTLRRLLFGTIPERLLLAEDGVAIAIARAGHPVWWRMRRRVEQILDLTVPQLERDQRIALFDSLRNGARWNFDFLALISLSTAIATMGLLQNSTAVVIGAMLVAPLMTPLLAAGLALLQGNLPLMKESSRAILYGFLTALAIAFLIAALTPMQGLTPEILSRGGAGILDMEVALLSGMAAAYCSARPGLSAALPGVAIAAALVPPIAATGIALSAGQGIVARGAALLFLTNIVAIILGAVISFYGAGIRSLQEQSERKIHWARKTLVALVLAMAVLTVPLSSVLMSSASRQESDVVQLKRTVESSLSTDVLPKGITLERVAVHIQDGKRKIAVYLNAGRPLRPGQLQRLTGALQGVVTPQDALAFHTLLVSKVLGSKVRSGRSN